MSSGQNGKGASRRREDARRIRANWDLVNWKRPAPKPLDKQPKT